MKIHQLILSDGRSVRMRRLAADPSWSQLSPAVRGVHGDIVKLPAQVAVAYRALESKKEQMGEPYWGQVSRVLEMAYGLAKAMEYGRPQRPKALTRSIPVGTLEALRDKVLVPDMDTGLDLESRAREVESGLASLADQVLSDQAFSLRSLLDDERFAEGISLAGWIHGVSPPRDDETQEESNARNLAAARQNISEIFLVMEQMALSNVDEWRQGAYKYIAYLYHTVEDFALYWEGVPGERRKASGAKVIKTAAGSEEIEALLRTIEEALGKASGVTPQGDADEAYLSQVRSRLENLKGLVGSIAPPPQNVAEEIRQ